MSETILFYLTAVMLVSLFLVLVAGLRGPTIYDRMLAVNAFGSKTMVLIVLLAMVVQFDMLIDIALVYAMINFITTIGFLGYVRWNQKGEKA